MSKEATAVCNKFKPVLSLFAKCHFIYNQKIVSEERQKNYVGVQRRYMYTHAHTPVLHVPFCTEASIVIGFKKRGSFAQN